MGDRLKKLGPRVTVSVTVGDYNALSALADEGDVSVSWVVRRAIQEYLEHHQSRGLIRRAAPVKSSSAAKQE